MAECKPTILEAEGSSGSRGDLVPLTQIPGDDLEESTAGSPVIPDFRATPSEEGHVIDAPLEDSSHEPQPNADPEGVSGASAIEPKDLIDFADVKVEEPSSDSKSPVEMITEPEMKGSIEAKEEKSLRVPLIIISSPSPRADIEMMTMTEIKSPVPTPPLALEIEIDPGPILVEGGERELSLPAQTEDTTEEDGTVVKVELMEEELPGIEIEIETGTENGPSEAPLPTPEELLEDTKPEPMEEEGEGSEQEAGPVEAVAILTFKDPVKPEPMEIDLSPAPEPPSEIKNQPPDQNGDDSPSSLSKDKKEEADPHSTCSSETEKSGVSGGKAPPTSKPAVTVVRKILTRTAKPGALVRRRRRKRLMTRQRQTGTSSAKAKVQQQQQQGRKLRLRTQQEVKNEGDEDDGEMNIKEDDDDGTQEKFSPRRQTRKRRLASAKRDKEQEQSEEEDKEPPPPKRTLLSSAVLTFEGVMYHLGDIVQMTGDDGYIYYAQIQRFLTDDYCEKYIMIRWLVPRAGIPSEKHFEPSNFDPSYFVQGPYQDEPINMRDIDFVMRASRLSGPGQNSPIFNQCGEHAIIFNTNIPEVTGTSISHCKL